MLHGVIIDHYNTLECFGLALLADVEVGSPKPQESRIVIPGRNGTLRLGATYYGTPVYGDRTIRFTLFRACTDRKLLAAWHEFAAMVHGQQVQLILPWEPNFYYYGTMKLGSISGYNSGVIPVAMTAEPYKYSVIDSTEQWLWDDFCFSTDVARAYSELPVNGDIDGSSGTAYKIIGSRMPVVPVFVVKSTDGLGIAVEVINEDHQIPDSCLLPDGESSIEGLVLHDAEYHFYFKGNGTVSILFREGAL